MGLYMLESCYSWGTPPGALASLKSQLSLGFEVLYQKGREQDFVLGLFPHSLLGKIQVTHQNRLVYDSGSL